MKGVDMSTNKIEYMINVDMHGKKANQTIMLDVDENGTPLDRIWRRRFNDAKIDGCITKVEQPKSKPSNEEKDKV